MPTEVLMPTLSPTMKAGKLARWLKSEGDSVVPGEVLAEIETDKATMEIEAVDEGTLGKILVPEGSEEVPVKTPIAVMLADNNDVLPEGGETQITRPQQRSSTEAASAEETLIKAPVPEIADTQAVWNGETITQTVREALRDAMAEEMRKDQNVMLMGEEVGQYQGAYKVSQGLLDEFSDERVIDTPITEHGFAGLAVGAAFTGNASNSRVHDFQFCDAGYGSNCKFSRQDAIYVRWSDGVPDSFSWSQWRSRESCRSTFSMLCSLVFVYSGSKVVAPWSASDAKGLLKSAIRDPNPIIFLENEILYGHSSEVPVADEWTVPIGSANVVRAGNDVTLVAFSIMVGKAIEAAEKVAEDGISAEVIDLRTLRPLDASTIVRSVKKTNRLVTCEEGFPQSGVGARFAPVLRSWHLTG